MDDQQKADLYKTLLWNMEAFRLLGDMVKTNIMKPISEIGVYRNNKAIESLLQGNKLNNKLLNESKGDSVEFLERLWRL